VCNLPADFTAYDALEFGLGTLHRGEFFTGKGKGQKTWSAAKKLCVTLGVNGSLSVLCACHMKTAVFAGHVKSAPRAVVYYVENERVNCCSLTAVTEILGEASDAELTAAIDIFDTAMTDKSSPPERDVRRRSVKGKRLRLHRGSSPLPKRARPAVTQSVHANVVASPNPPVGPPAGTPAGLNVQPVHWLKLALAFS